MIRDISMHRTDDAQIVDAGGGRLGKQFADFDPTLAILLKLVGRLKRAARLPFSTQSQTRQRLAMIFFQCRLGIKSINLRIPAIHEEVHHPLGLTRQRRLLRCQRRVIARRSPRRQLFSQHAGQRQGTKAGASPSQHVTARNRRQVVHGHLVVERNWQELIRHRPSDCKQSGQQN